MIKKFSKLKSSWIKPIIIVILCTIFTSIGQVFLKIGSSRISNFISIFNLPLIVGLISYVLGAVLLIIALKYGDLSLIYPFIALSFIWVTLLSIYLFNEHVLLANWLGILCILFGVSLIGLGGRK